MTALKKADPKGATIATTKRKLVSWLLQNGFEQMPGGQTSHRHYRHGRSGTVVTVSGHGRAELSKKHLGLLLRQLEGAGFDKRQVRRELGG